MRGQSYPLGIVQEIKICPYEQMVYALPNICSGEFDVQTPLVLWHINGSPNLGQTTRPYNNQQKNKTCKIVDFAVPADHKVKLIESEKKDKYFDLARELKNWGTWK